MQPDKPHLFIGSSSEAIDRQIIDRIVTTLSPVAHCIPWNIAPQFSTKGSSTTFSALCAAANDYDFALFVFTPDDKTQSRTAPAKPAPRDNVVYELGLFTSAIGPDRVEAIVEKSDEALKVPSDLSGVNMPRFAFHDGDPQSSVAEINQALRGFAAKIAKDSFRKIDLPLAYEWYFDSKHRQLVVDLAAAKITRARSTIGDWRLTVAARIYDPKCAMEFDSNVKYAELRKLPDDVNENISIFIEEKAFGRALTESEKLEARVLLVPPEPFKFDASATLDYARKCRCREIERLTLKLGKM